MITFRAFIVHHPERDAILPDLLDALGDPGRVEVVVDAEPERRNPWKAWRDALRYAATFETTHTVMLEDDIRPCRDFLAGVEKCIEARPTDLLRFYHAAEPYGAVNWRQVQEDGGHWFPINGGWGCVQAIAFPTEWIGDFLHYGESIPKLGNIFPDARLALWMKTRMGQPVWTTVPTLVRHGWPSMCGQPHHDTPDEMWIGDDVSALSIDWSA